MATTHFARTIYKGTASLGKAAARIAYITRTEQYAPAAARIRHQGLQTGTELMREDLVLWEHHNLPPWAAGKPIHFFTMAERYEGRLTAYEEWKVSLPRELLLDQQVAAARDFLHAAFGTTHPYVFAMHNPPAADRDPDAAEPTRNPHVHVLWSARILDGRALPPAQFFKKVDRHHPERGGGGKGERFYHKGAVKAERILYTDIMNVHLEAAGQMARLHPEKLSVQGIDYRQPEPRLHVKDSNRLKFAGEVTERMRMVFTHRAARFPYAAKENALADQAWELRKLQLGITHDMPLPQQLARVQNAREEAIRQRPLRLVGGALEREASQRLRTIRHLEKELRAGKSLPQSTRSWGQGLRRLAALLARHQADEDEQARGALHVRLHERDQDRGW